MWKLSLEEELRKGRDVRNDNSLVIGISQGIGVYFLFRGEIL